MFSWHPSRPNPGMESSNADLSSVIAQTLKSSPLTFGVCCWTSFSLKQFLMHIDPLWNLWNPHLMTTATPNVTFLLARGPLHVSLNSTTHKWKPQTHQIHPCELTRGWRVLNVSYRMNNELTAPRQLHRPVFHVAAKGEPRPRESLRGEKKNSHISHLTNARDPEWEQ